MNFNLYQLCFNSMTIIESLKVDESNFPVHIKNKLDKFFEITSDLYFQKQSGRKGIKNLGDKLRYDSNLKELFTSSNDSLIIKATGNRMSFLKLFVDSVSHYEYDKIYFLIFTKELNNLSQIFDKTTTTIGDIELQMNSLKNITEKLNIPKRLFILEIHSFPSHNFFLTSENFSKIYEKK